MKKYLSIYLALVRINYTNLFAHRANLFNSIIASFVWSIFVISSMTLLTSKSSHIFGWQRNELLLVAGVYNVIYSIFYILFARNFEEFSFRVHLGTLDGVLLKPISSQFFMSNWLISLHQVVRFSIGLGFVLYMLHVMHITITPYVVLLFIFLTIFSVMIIYSLWFLIMTLTVWQSHLRNLVELLYSINGITRYPQEMYKRVSVVFFWIVLPLTLVIITPTKLLAGTITAVDVILLAITALILFTLSHFFWKFALRFYVSAN